MSKMGEIIRGDDQTISIPTPSLFPTTIGASVALFVVPTSSVPPDVYLDPTALITAQLGPFVTEVDSFDFVLTSAVGAASSLIPLGTYNWYARFKDAGNKLTSIQLNPENVEVIPPKGDDC